MTEQWKAVKGLEGSYEVSNFGKIKSLLRGIMLKGCVSADGYRMYNQYLSPRYSHLLVWDAFGNKARDGRKSQVDHIDNDKLNNRADNLQLLTNRQNTTKYTLTAKTSSEYTGVSWGKECGKWTSRLQVNGKLENLGVFVNEYDAHLAYQARLRQVEFA